MKFSNVLPWCVLAVAGVFAVGCTSTSGSTAPADTGGGVADTADGDGAGSGYTRGIGTDNGVSGGAMSGGSDADAGMGGAGAPPAPTVLYFDFDSSSVRADYAELLGAHSRYIMESGVLSVSIQGHADERGSREYNIGLGERRAQAVRQVLQSLGVSGTRLRTVSWGEERPVAFGHDDASWAANRRVEIVYGSR